MGGWVRENPPKRVSPHYLALCIWEVHLWCGREVSEGVSANLQLQGTCDGSDCFFVFEMIFTIPNYMLHDGQGFNYWGPFNPPMAFGEGGREGGMIKWWRRGSAVLQSSLA